MVVEHDVFAASITRSLARRLLSVVCLLSSPAVRPALVSLAMHLTSISGFVPRSYRRFIPPPPLSRPPFVGRCVAGLCGLLYRTVLFLLLLQNEE
jgi:hypothetical protein